MTQKPPSSPASPARTAPTWQLLLEKGYAVHGIKRRASSFNTGRVDHLYHAPHTSGRN